jgi:hypothetical protein
MRPTEILATDLGVVVVTAAGVLVAAIAAVVAWIARNDSRAANEIAGKATVAAGEANKIASEALDAGKRQASAAEHALALSVRPIIVGDPKAEAPFSYRTEPIDTDNRAGLGDFAFYISFPIRNMGVGPALIYDAYIETVSKGTIVDGSGTRHGGIQVEVNRKVIAPGEDALFYCRMPSGLARGAPEDIKDNGLSACIRYTDIAEGQKMLTIIGLIVRAQTKDMRMVNLDFFACNRDWTRSPS